MRIGVSKKWASELPWKPVRLMLPSRPTGHAIQCPNNRCRYTQQARNIDGSLALNGQAISRGPVLLIDDMVDSRWTLTVSAWLLRKGGSGEVWPMALSQTGHDE